MLKIEFASLQQLKFTTAHPRQTGEKSIINISVTHAQNSTYDIIEILPSKGEQDEHPLEGGKLLYSILPASGVAYIHSFCITENYVVVPETPLVLGKFVGSVHTQAQGFQFRRVVSVEARTALQVSCGRQKTRDIRWHVHSASIFRLPSGQRFRKRW